MSRPSTYMYPPDNYNTLVYFGDHNKIKITDNKRRAHLIQILQIAILTFSCMVMCALPHIYCLGIYKYNNYICN